MVWSSPIAKQCSILCASPKEMNGAQHYMDFRPNYNKLVFKQLVTQIQEATKPKKDEERKSFLLCCMHKRKKENEAIGTW
ncbi:MAG: hypothetical protein Q8761_02790 [Sweet potato little leaf phytoplasma]|nr:hypothetical protein [Sweet potato little leaf phytoplasma]